jgi:beta-lactamase regulating signal transducer with metallopeptidase domain
MRLFVFSFLALLMPVCVLAAEPIVFMEMPEFKVVGKIPHTISIAFVSEVSTAEVSVEDSAIFAKKAESETSRLVKLCICLGVFAVAIVCFYFFFVIRVYHAFSRDKRLRSELNSKI